MLRVCAEIADVGFSPSALTSYIRNPIQFYFQKILRNQGSWRSWREYRVEHFGKPLSMTLKSLYESASREIWLRIRYAKLLPSKSMMMRFWNKVVYKEGEIKKGRNLLAFWSGEGNVSNFLEGRDGKYKSGRCNKDSLALEQIFERILNPSNFYHFRGLIKVMSTESKNATE
jgi:hypothetical protein